LANGRKSSSSGNHSKEKSFMREHISLTFFHVIPFSSNTWKIDLAQSTPGSVEYNPDGWIELSIRLHLLPELYLKIKIANIKTSVSTLRGR
jgi:hypothetical protein